MNKNLRLFVFRCEETHDIAMPRAAIKMIVFIQNHIFRPLNFTGTDQFCIRQLRIQSIGRTAVRQGRQRRLHGSVHGCDINLIKHLVSVFQPPDVENHCKGEHQAQNHLVGSAVIPHPNQAVIDGQHDQAAQHSFYD